MAPDSQNFRGIHADRVLRGVKNLTLDGLIKLAHDPYLPAFAVQIPGLIEAADAVGLSAGPTGLDDAISVLRGWDYTTSATSEAMTIAHFYGMKTLGYPGLPRGLSRMERQTWFATQAPAADRVRLLADTVAELTNTFGTHRIPWADVNRFQRLDGAIQQRFDDTKPSIGVSFASGLWGALASYGVRKTPTDKLYGAYGNSFVAAVEFGDKVRAKSMLVGGQSGDPTSPHFRDQAQRYVDINWKDVAFYRADVEARAKRRYHPGLR